MTFNLRVCMCRLEQVLVSLVIAAAATSCVAATPDSTVDPERNAQVMQVDDSAGVLVIHYPGELTELPTLFRIAPEPLADLGGSRLGGPEELSPRYFEHTALRMSDGRVIVPNGDLMVQFGVDGGVIRTIGTHGQGPGEFSRVDSVCLMPGDTIVAVDGRRRWHMFTDTGEFVETFTSSAEFIPAGCLPDGSMIHLVSDPRGDTDVEKVTPRGVRSGPLYTFKGPTSRYLPRVNNAPSFQSRVYVGDGQEPQIVVVGDNGTVTEVIRWDATSTPVSEDVLARLVHATIPTSNTAPGRFESELARAKLTLAATHIPFYGEIRIDALGRMWVQDYTLGIGLLGTYPSSWTILNADGAPIGRVQLPTLSPAPEGKRRRMVDLRGVFGDQVLLRWEDELGFVHLSYHRLEAVK
jgi:hypothetical protein